MKRANIFRFLLCILLFALILGIQLNGAELEKKGADITKIEKKVKELLKKANIPGLSLIVIGPDQQVLIKEYGYADLESKTPLTPETKFELCSTSKAFTGLAILQCEADGLLNLDDPVSKFFPEFYMTYKGTHPVITLRHLAHQTSGIPYFKTLGQIPEGDAPDSLERFIKIVSGSKLDFLPGERYSYSTTNYSILGAVIAKVSGMSYEDYMKQKIYLPLGLNDTVTGLTPDVKTATGYKISFFSPRKYVSPLFRANNPAGYIISNSNDIARWMQIQLGNIETPLSALVQKTHQSNSRMPIDQMGMTGPAAYTFGWRIALDGSGDIDHAGGNPNFTCQFIFNPDNKTAVAVLANSNSIHTPFIAWTAFNMLNGRPLPSDTNLGSSGGMDKGFSLFLIMSGLAILGIIAFLLIVFLQIIKKQRKFEGITFRKLFKMLITFIILLPFAYGLQLLPSALADLTWKVANVWSPITFLFCAYFILAAMGLGYISYLFSSIFPHRNKYIRQAPSLAVMSVLSGLSNAIVIFLLTQSLNLGANPEKLKYILYYFMLAVLLYLIGRKELQVKLVNISFDIIYDLRMTLIDKIFRTSYQRFEKLDTGRVIATLTNDTGQLGGMANTLVAILTSLITIVGAFAFLASIEFWTTAVTLGVIVIVATIYFIVGQRSNVLFNESRNTQNVYMGLLNGMRAGFKELSLHTAKKNEYRKEIESTTIEFRDKSTRAMVNFVNAFMVGESLLLVVLAAVGFGIPQIMPDLSRATLMSFIMVLLYLIGPVNGVLNSIPQLIQMRIAWQRIQGLIKDVPANIDETQLKAITKPTTEDMVNIKADGVYFSYETKEASEKFVVGPVDFEAKKGEIIFIVGGNGSGKTTFAKLLTGLYLPESGKVTMNGKEVDHQQLGEYFSVVFGDYHLFDKLYDIDLAGKEDEVKEYLEMLRLQDKVKIENNAFTTTELSGGQRKRLALLRCYLEDRPIYLFDEIAADQDPEFRKFFYRTLLTRMKEKGKTVIAITHDDHYFDVADRVVKMDMGKVETVESGTHFTVTK